MDDSYQSDSMSYEEQDEDYQPFSLSDNDIQNEKFIGEKAFKNLPLSSNVKQYFEKFKKTNTKTFIKLFNFKDQVPQHKSVCAKSINKGDTIAQCYDCATDSSCIQCIDCFKNSNHEGHKVVIKKAYGGCCDCGDIEAWKKQGFCAKHTGQCIDIQIDSKESEHFVTEMKQLFFLMFWESIQNNENNCKEYSKKLLQNLSYLNQKGVYYNKLTCMVFGSKIPQDLIVSKNVNNRTILGNILSPKVAKNLNIDDWMELFFTMFQYYPFKKLLLRTYVKNFSMIYSDEESEMRGSSIACQLLTSHQLVREYALEEGSVPLGSDIKIQKLTFFERPFHMMYHDLNYFIKLAGDTPQVYFRFHMRNPEGILKLFEYRKIIKVLQDKEKQQPDILQLARFVKHFQMEFEALELVSKIAGILQKDKETLQIVIKTLFEEALKEENEKKMIIFKPLTRALTIFLFAYFDLDLHNLEYSKNQEKIDRLFEIFNTSSQGFGNSINKIFKICVQSYLFHAKTLAQPGLNSTLYVYIYCYKMKNRLISSIDILSVKLFSIMHNWPQINKQIVICPQDYLWQNKFTVTEQAKKQQLESKMSNLKFILLELNLITASQSNELYVAYDMNPECGLYQNYIQCLLLKILNQEKTSVSLAVAKEYEESFFHKNTDIAHNYLKKFCNFDKAKKAFVLANQMPENESDQLNYSDFRCNLTNKNEFQSPQKTLQLIRLSKSQHIFDSLWSIETIKKFVVKVIEFMKAFKGFAPQSTTELLVEKFNTLFIQLMKILYIKKMIAKKPEQLEVVLQFLRKVENINSFVNPFYETLINSSKMEEEKGENEMNQEKQESPKKLGLQNKKSTEDQRKKILKQRMQQKKKTIKQRYAKQLAAFEKQEKNKLDKEQELEQTEHSLNCIICKSQNQNQLVYFTHISFKNHEKLLKLGDGVTCLSVQSCYHSVDFACYSKMAAEVGNKKRPTVKCPFCKFRSNTFFPVLSQSKHSDEAIKKFEMAIFLQKNVDQISIVEEVIKSFYHFSLLAYLDPQRTVHRRLKIYRIILEIIQAHSKVYSVAEVYKKFMTRTMNLNPMVLEDEEDELTRSEGLLELSLLLQNSAEGISMDDLSEDQIDHLLNMIAQRQNRPSQNNNNGGMFGSLVNKLKEKIFQVKRKQSEVKESHQNYTPIFKETLMRLFKFLGIKDIEQKPVSNHQTVSMIQQELAPQIQMCLKKLFDQKTPHQFQHQNSIYEKINDNNNLLKLRDLPMNFRPLGRLNKCHYCQQISSSITLCLLCDWQGCLKNCLKDEKNEKGDKNHNKKGGSFNHSKVHGEQSLFLLMQKCYVAKISSEGHCEILGCIYKDEWGNDFNNKESWESFFLDEGEMSKMKLAFLHDQ